jgi:hypothetical protein
LAVLIFHLVPLTVMSTASGVPNGNSPNLSSRAQRLGSLANPIAKSRDLVFEFAIRRRGPMDNPTCFIDKIKSEAEIE